MVELSEEREYVFGSEKTLIVRLYQVLYEYSDAAHPLTQSEIIDLLDKNRGI